MGYVFLVMAALWGWMGNDMGWRSPEGGNALLIGAVFFAAGSLIFEIRDSGKPRP